LRKYKREKVKRFKFEVMGMGFNNSSYPGAFTKPIEDIIRNHIAGTVLHLFSGSSLIGDTRVDINHKNATLNYDVKDFIKTDKEHWDWVILDPPYNITRVGTKLKGYGLSGCVASDVSFRRALKAYFQEHTENVMWLDICAPMVKGFQCEKLWLLLPGGFYTVRVLTWLKREMKPLI
jgi:hypothetical protein